MNVHFPLEHSCACARVTFSLCALATAALSLSACCFSSDTCTRRSSTQLHNKDTADILLLGNNSGALGLQTIENHDITPAFLPVSLC